MTFGKMTSDQMTFGKMTFDETEQNFKIMRSLIYENVQKEKKNIFQKKKSFFITVNKELQLSCSSLH